MRLLCPVSGLLLCTCVIGHSAQSALREALRAFYDAVDSRYYFWSCVFILHYYDISCIMIIELY